MAHDFIFTRPGKATKAYSPEDYGLPVWRDAEHAPKANADQQTPASSPAFGGMTVEQAKARLLAWCMAQVGIAENENNWNKYAALPEITELYGWTPQNQPWCDIFTDAAFVSVFGLKIGAAMTYQPIGGGSALCRTSALYFREAGAWSKSPEAGDVIFFYRGGEINHQGIVSAVDGGSVYTIEGNCGDKVSERCYSLSDGSIAGYGRPRWELAAEIDETGETGGEIADPVNTYVLKLPVLRQGNSGAGVIAVQFQLLGQGYSVGPDGADGEYGGNTAEAIKEFQLNVGLSPDGVVGPQTGARLFGGEIVQHTPTATPPDPEETASDPTLWDKLKTKLRRGPK